MDTANTPYTFGMATGEIITLLLLAFLLGMLLCWLLRQMGLCCRPRKKSKLGNINLNLPQPAPKRAMPEAYVPKVKVQPRLVDLPAIDATVDLPTVELPAPEVDLQATEPSWLTKIDPHKPIIDPPDMDIEADIDLDILDTKLEAPLLPLEPLLVASPTSIELPTIDPLLAAIDPHKPIIDSPDTVWETETNLEAPMMQIDPHKPIVDPPDMPEETHTSSGNGNLFNDWLHKAKDSVEHLTEKATPTTNEWLHKAKESVDHLTEKATPVTTEWLHKAKEIGSNISAKSHNINASETLAKGSSTLAALATSAKELTEKLASNLSSKQDDLQKLVGIGPTFASILHRAGINSYQQLADTSVQKLQALLIVEDEQFSQHDTSSWPRQAALAAYGEWDQLKAYQDSL